MSRKALVSIFMFTSALAEASAAVAAPAQTTVQDVDALKKVVFRVSSVYEPPARRLFGDLGDKFHDVGVQQRNANAVASDVFESLSKAMQKHARGEHSSGSGWLLTDPEDPATTYIITNAHVIGAGYSVTAEPADQPTRHIRAPVLYVDPVYDLAIVGVTESIAPRGLDPEPAVPKDGTKVQSAGFPKGEWAFTEATISNNAVHHELYGTVIGHGAPIDFGSSGGPLLVKDGVTGEFRVVGVNTWKRTDRSTSSSVAIPVKYVLESLKRAKKAVTMQDRPVELRAQLEHDAKTLASELSSPEPHADKVAPYFSYAMITERKDLGLTLALTSMAAAPRSRMADLIEEFGTQPAEFIRLKLVMVWLLDMSTSGRSIAFKEIIYSDLDSIGRQRVIRTKFMFGNSLRELGWIYEHGHWRLASFEEDWKKLGELAAKAAATERVEEVLLPAALPVTTVTKTDDRPAATPSYFEGSRSPGLLVRLGLATHGADGDLLDGTNNRDTTAPAFGFGLDVLQSRFFALELGASYLERGAVFSFTDSGQLVSVSEQVKYIQLPLIFRFGYQWSASVATIRAFFRVGGGMDIAVEKAGRGMVGNQPTLLGSEWYQDHRGYNVAVIYGAGIEMAFGQDRQLFWGLEFLADKHLLPELTNSTAGNYKYAATTPGVYVKYDFE